MHKHGWIKWFVLYMTLAGGNYMVYSMVLPVRIFHHVIVSAILLFWFLKYGLPSTPLLGSFVIMALSVLISAFTSNDKRMALEFAWHWITNGVLLLLLIDWMRIGREKELLRYQMMAGAMVAGSCLLEWLLYRNRPGGMFFNINLAGGYVSALLLPVLHAAWHSRDHSRWLYGALSVLMLLVLALNQSRGAILCLTVSIVAFVILQEKSAKRALLMSSIPLIIVLAIIAPLSDQTHHALGDIERLDLWRVAGELINSHPLGVGPGLFGQAYQVMGKSGEYRFTGAHSLYLNLGAELGGAGLASGAVSVLLFIYCLIYVKRTPAQNASLAALCGIATHMAVDNFPSQGYTFLVSLLIAHVVHDCRVPFDLPRFRWASAGVVILGAAFMLYSDRAQIVYERSLATQSYSLAQEAARLDPYNRLYQIQYSRVAHDGSWENAETIDPGLKHSISNLMMYGLVNYGRVFQ